MKEETRDHLHRFVHLLAAVYILLLYFAPFALHFSEFITPVILIDTVVSIIYFFDLFLRKNKDLALVTYIWSAIPFFLIFGFTPLALMLNVGKLLRGLRALGKLHVVHYGLEFQTALKVTLTFVSLILYFSTLIVLIEGSVNANLETFGGGLWWAIVTITTTGYGDVTPETPLGRVAASFLMLMGIGISSTIGALFVSYLLRPTERRILSEEQRVEKTERRVEKDEGEVLKLVRSIDKRVASLEQKTFRTQSNRRKRDKRRK